MQQTLMNLPARFLLGFLSLASAQGASLITDQTNYNVGSQVMARLAPSEEVTASIRYAGENQSLASGIHLKGAGYQLLWKIPWNAKTGRYEIDLIFPKGAPPVRNTASFAVHRQLAKVTAFELDRTFYTAGDTVNPRIIVQNISNQALEHLQVEFEGYTYPWIAPAADERPAWKTIAAKSLSLAPGAMQEFRLTNAATVQATGRQTNVYFSAVIRDSVRQDRIYDLAFALPAITAPVKKTDEKTYPFLYLYSTLNKVPESESYRRFYLASYVSDLIRFDKKHTMFGADASPRFSFVIAEDSETIPVGGRAEFRVLDRERKPVVRGNVAGPLVGNHVVSIKLLKPGAYTLEVAILTSGGIRVAANRLDLATNDLPKSILLFCAHQDDDTAHPEMIRAAVENNIPIHVVYFTSGDAGGCDRYYMHSCDASRAMDFGEVRMNEARASLNHLGVPAKDIFFLGLPDGGMEQIWRTPSSTNPYLSVLLASEHSPYRDTAKPNLTYARDAVLEVTEGFIEKYQPELIITGHPDERHVDHRTNNWIVVKAMQALLKAHTLNPNTKLVVDASYGPRPQKHAPYQYERFQFYVSGEAATLGQEATWYYQSQDGNHEQAEIVTYDKLPREAPKPHFGQYYWPYPHYRILDWQKHEGWNE
jgi:LmbE family N-acetylglucosaminyl deacetylase